jgi:hypothetical protein
MRSDPVAAGRKNEAAASDLDSEKGNHEPQADRRYGGHGRSSDYTYAIGMSPDGSRVFVAGSHQVGPEIEATDYGTVAYAG